MHKGVVFCIEIKANISLLSIGRWNVDDCPTWPKGIIEIQIIAALIEYQLIIKVDGAIDIMLFFAGRDHVEGMWICGLKEQSESGHILIERKAHSWSLIKEEYND